MWNIWVVRVNGEPWPQYWGQIRICRAKLDRPSEISFSVSMSLSYDSYLCICRLARHLSHLWGHANSYSYDKFHSSFHLTLALSGSHRDRKDFLSFNTGSCYDPWSLPGLPTLYVLNLLTMGRLRLRLSACDAMTSLACNQRKLELEVCMCPDFLSYSSCHWFA